MPARVYALVVSVSVLFVLGLVMIFNTTSAEIMDLSLEKSPHAHFLKQIGYAIPGGLLAFLFYTIGARRWIQMSPWLLGLGTVLLLLCLIPGIGKSVNGSRRWLGVGPLSFQPSEFVKLIVPAFFIARLYGQEITFGRFLQAAALVFVPIALILVEPNNGTAGVIFLTVVVLSFLMEVPVKYWALPLLGAILVGGAVASQLPYVQSRLKIYLNPELDLLGKGHQPYQAKIAAGSGELFGRGPGNSVQKLSYLPEAQNDYIAAIYAEEFGFVGVSVLIVLYLVIAYQGFVISYLAKSGEERLLAATISFLIAFQAFMNMGVVSGLLPSTGLNLPFFSQGGTSLMANMVALALLASVRCSDKTKSVHC